MSLTTKTLAAGLHGEICGADPIVDGEEWSCNDTEVIGNEIILGLEDENGRAYGARLAVVEVWAE